jgi:hypothetical protein
MMQKMDYPCGVLLIKNILKESKIWIVSGSFFDSPLSFTGMSVETRVSCVIKKMSVKKSHWTVPLSNLELEEMRLVELLILRIVELEEMRLVELLILRNVQLEEMRLLELYILGNLDLEEMRLVELLILMWS